MIWTTKTSPTVDLWAISEMAITYTVDDAAFKASIDKGVILLHKSGEDSRKASARGIKRVTLLIHRDAVRNAPKSPTQAELMSVRKLKTRRARKARSVGRPSPGGLERSIEMLTDDRTGIVFVSAGSQAGKYAGRIHDQKGEKWFNRGPGTMAKGPQADEKFIKRALDGNELNAVRVLKHEHSKEGLDLK